MKPSEMLTLAEYHLNQGTKIAEAAKLVGEPHATEARRAAVTRCVTEPDSRSDSAAAAVSSGASGSGEVHHRRARTVPS